MRTVTAFVAAAGFLILGLRTASAQHEHHADPATAPAAQSGANDVKGKDMMGKMGQGKMGMGEMAMHRDMMASPLHEASVPAFAMPEMQSELGLSAQQAAQLREMKQVMLATVKAQTAQIQAKQKDLEALLAAAEPQISDVKKRMTELATLKSERPFTIFEAAAKMKASLTNEQRSKLNAVTPKQIHEILMMRVPMEEHNALMSALR